MAIVNLIFDEKSCTLEALKHLVICLLFRFNSVPLNIGIFSSAFTPVFLIDFKHCTEVFPQLILIVAL